MWLRRIKYFHVCGLETFNRREASTLYQTAFLWGSSENGQIGQSSKVRSHPFAWSLNNLHLKVMKGQKVQVKPLRLDHRSGFLDVACGDQFSIGVDGNNQLFFWGKQFSGSVISWLPKLYQLKSKFVSCAAGKQHCAAICLDGLVHTWGVEGSWFQSAGHLGHGERKDIEIPK